MFSIYVTLAARSIDGRILLLVAVRIRLVGTHSWTSWLVMSKWMPFSLRTLRTAGREDGGTMRSTFLPGAMRWLNKSTSRHWSMAWMALACSCVAGHAVRVLYLSKDKCGLESAELKNGLSLPECLAHPKPRSSQKKNNSRSGENSDSAEKCPRRCRNDIEIDAIRLKTMTIRHSTPEQCRRRMSKAHRYR